MGNSNYSVQQIADATAGKGIPVPMQGASGYGTDTVMRGANDVMSKIIKKRFNWKWNRKNAPPFYTNSFQQDYPMIGITDLAWLEDADRVDINNTAIPKPIVQLTCRRQLSRRSLSWRPITELCWMYNSQLFFGTWPGPQVTLYPLVVPAGPVKQNPLLSMVDANGNFLIVTSFGTTGLVAPLLPANSPEGTQVIDGGTGYGIGGYGSGGYGSGTGVVWTVVGPQSQGFRVDPLPGASGPVYQVLPYYQVKAPTLLNLQSLINPIPDDYSWCFQDGFDAFCLRASPNPADKQRGIDAEKVWIQAMVDVAKQGDREADVYGMLPAENVVENIYAWRRNPQDPSQPY